MKCAAGAVVAALLAWLLSDSAAVVVALLAWLLSDSALTLRAIGRGTAAGASKLAPASAQELTDRVARMEKVGTSISGEVIETSPSVFVGVVEADGGSRAHRGLPLAKP